MPLTVKSAEAQSRIDAFGEDPIEPIFDDKYSFRTKDVQCIDMPLDFRDLPPHSEITMNIPDIQKKVIHVYVSEGSKVRIPPFNTSRVPVKVHEPDGNVYKARGMVYLSTSEKREGSDTVIECINGHYKFKEPLPPTQDKLVVGSYVTTPQALDFGEEILCRHLSVLNHLFKQKEFWREVTDWKTLRESYLSSQENVSTLVAKGGEWEALNYDAMLGSSRICLGVKPELMSSYFYAQFKFMEDEMKQSGATVAEKGILIHMDKDDAEGHLMYANFQIKPDKHGQMMYKLKTYDPNTSFMHLGMTTPNPLILLSTTVQDWFPKIGRGFYNKINFFELNPEFPVVSNIDAGDTVNQYVLNTDHSYLPILTVTASSPKKDYLAQYGFSPRIQAEPAEPHTSHGYKTAWYREKMQELREKSQKPVEEAPKPLPRKKKSCTIV